METLDTLHLSHHIPNLLDHTMIVNNVWNFAKIHFSKHYNFCLVLVMTLKKWYVLFITRSAIFPFRNVFILFTLKETLKGAMFVEGLTWGEIGINKFWEENNAS